MTIKSIPNTDHSLPRATPMQKKRVDWMAQQLKAALQDDRVRGYWGNLQWLAAQLLERPFEPKPEDIINIKTARRILGPDADSPGETMDALRTILNHVAPELMAFWGPLADVWIIDITRRRVTGEWPTEPRKMGQLLPGHPVRIGAQGELLAPDWTTVTPKQWLELQQYFASLRPAKPRGRPPGSHTKPITARPSRIDPQQANHALQLHREGKKWLEIAHALKLPYNRHDPKARDAVRKKVMRLIEHAAIAEKNLDADN
jgi:hypothetical protein